MPSSLTIRCKCGKSIEVSEDLVGRRIKCRVCKNIMEVRQRGRARNPVPQFGEGASRKRHQYSSQADYQTTHWIADGIDGFRRFIRNEWLTVTKLSQPQLSLTIISYAYLLSIVLVALLMWGAGDAWWPATIFLFIGRWIVLLPLAVLIPAAILLRRKCIAPLALAAAIAIFPILGFETGWRRLFARGDGVPLRIVSFNTEIGDSLAVDLHNRLADWNADIIAIQECGPLLQESINSLTDWNSNEENGVCLITKLAIKEIAVMNRSGYARMNEFNSDNIGGSADVVRYTLATPRGDIDVTTVHLETPRKGLEGFLSGENGAISRLKLNTELRDIESRSARAWVDRGTRRQIVLGDFNTPIESRIFRRHWGDLKNAYSQAGFGFGRTKLNGWIKVRIDHILHSEHFYTKKAFTGQQIGSDHRPVIADLVLSDK